MADRVVVGVLGAALAAGAVLLGVQQANKSKKKTKNGSTTTQPPHPLAMAPLPAPAGLADDAALAMLGDNVTLLSQRERALAAALLTLGQGHLFALWPPLGVGDADKRRLIEQLARLDAAYHGGLAAYVSNARRLLAESRDGINPFEGFVPAVPAGVTLDYASAPFLEAEAAGLAEAPHTAFVLVAGGLGERLGYSGIKLALPAESATGRCFLRLYCEHIGALQARTRTKAPLPLAIMTSDDTHARTAALLEEHGYFGLRREQVTLIKQEKVACLADGDARLALEPKDAYAVQTKPHGHGDVHALLHSSGLAKRWGAAGVRWVCFFQDTNALVFRAMLAALGTSAARDYDVNSLAVPRRAKEAIGALATLSNASTGAVMTINVEYNQLDPLLRGTTHPEGDANDPATGFSPFPGNINQIILKLQPYAKQLAATGGVIAEFVNPKYADASRTAFKSSTRLECMMQDYPKALPPAARVGFTVINQVWATYSPVKNAAADARAKAAEGVPTHSATTGEMDIYKAGALTLAAVAEADIGLPQPGEYNGIAVEEYPRVVLTPAFAPSVSDVASKVSPGGMLLAPRSVLVLDGAGISVRNLRVDGALVVRAAPGARVTLDGLSVSNAGWRWLPLEELPPGSDRVREEEAMRGFRVLKDETLELVFDDDGDYNVPSRPVTPADGEAAPAAPSRKLQPLPSLGGSLI